MSAESLHDTRPKKREQSWKRPVPRRTNLPLTTRSPQVIGRAVLVLAPFFVFLIGIAQLQPDRLTAARNAVLPADCSQPCFLGIQPGVTPLHVAADRLRQHPWVENVRMEGDINLNFLRWSWNGTQPAALTPPDPALRPFIVASSAQVRMIYLPTRLAYGDVWNWWGEPEAVRTTLTGRQSGISPDGSWRFVDHASEYFNGAISVETITPCPFSVKAFWDAPVSFFYSNAEQGQPNLRLFSPPDWFADQPC